jgi:hypothetical protein
MVTVYTFQGSVLQYLAFSWMAHIASRTQNTEFLRELAWGAISVNHEYPICDSLEM